MANPREVFMEMLAKKKAANSKGAVVPTVGKGKLGPKAQAAADKADMAKRNTPVKKKVC
jgi:hypothetical protein